MASKSWIAALAVLVAVAAGSYLGLRALQPEPLPEAATSSSRRRLTRRMPARPFAR